MARLPGFTLICGVFAPLLGYLRTLFRLERRIYAALPGWDYVHMIVFRTAFWFVILCIGYLGLIAR